LESEQKTHFDVGAIRFFTDILILKILKKEPYTSANSITNSFYQKFNLAISSDEVHSVLDSLEKQGIIKRSNDGEKRVYLLSRQGKKIYTTFCSNQNNIRFQSVFQKAEGESF
jgi:predicted transcriptional regulator